MIDDEVALRNAAWEAGINPDTGLPLRSAARMRRMAERGNPLPAEELLEREVWEWP